VKGKLIEQNLHKTNQ